MQCTLFQVHGPSSIDLILLHSVLWASFEPSELRCRPSHWLVPQSEAVDLHGGLARADPGQGGQEAEVPSSQSRGHAAKVPSGGAATTAGATTSADVTTTTEANTTTTRGRTTTTEAFATSRTGSS